jgi:hypothetical protein
MKPKPIHYDQQFKILPTTTHQKKLSIVTNKVTPQVTGFSISSFSCLLSSSDHPSRQMQLTNAKKNRRRSSFPKRHTRAKGRPFLVCLYLSKLSPLLPPPSLFLLPLKCPPSVYLSIPTFACTTFLSFHAAV